MNLLSFEIQEHSEALDMYRYNLVIQWHCKIPTYNIGVREIDFKYEIKTLVSTYYSSKDLVIKAKNEFITKARAMGFGILDRV